MGKIVVHEFISLDGVFENPMWTAPFGYDPKMGARPMARTIQEHIKRPLAEELLFGRLVGGGHVRVSVAADGSTLEFEFTPNQTPELIETK